MQQQIADTPEKCLAYSPNWYLSQISSYDEQTSLFAFGSNSDIYIMNYNEKKYETFIQNNDMRQKISCILFLNPLNQNVNESDININTQEMSINHNIFIVAGSNNGDIFLYEYNLSNKTYKLLEMQNLVKEQTISFIQVDNNQFNNIFIKTYQLNVYLQNGSKFNISFDVMQKKITSMKLYIQSKNNLKLKLPSSSINYKDNIEGKQSTKQSVCGSIHLFEEGQLILYEQNTQVFNHSIKGKILTIDEIPYIEQQSRNQNTIKQYILLKKIKNYLFVNVVQIQHNENKEQIQNSKQVIDKDVDNKESETLDTNEQSKSQSNAQQNTQKYCIKNILDIEIFFIYTKKHNDLLQSSFSIHTLDEDNFVLTGKIGDIYIFNLTKLIQYAKNNNKITINPLSAQFDDTFYTKVPDSNHYDGIFSIQMTKNNKLITLSTDRKISFFKIKQQISNQQMDTQIPITNENEIQEEQKQDIQSLPYSLEFEWQLNCLGAKVGSLAISQVEKELVYMSCLDHTIRVWDSSKTHDQLYVKEYYKRLDKLKVKEMLLHPTVENVMILLLEDNPKKLIGYDLFKEKVSFEYTSNRDILNLKWIKNDLVEELQNIQFQNTQQTKGKEGNQVDNAPQKQIKVDQDKMEVKEKGCLIQNDDHNLFIFKKGGYATLLDLSTGTIALEDYSLCENKQNVQQFDFDIVGEDKILGVFAQLGCISFYNDYQYKQFFNIHKNVVKSISFKQTSNNLIICCGSLDRKISVYYGNQDDIQSFQLVTYLKHEFPIEKIRFSPLENIFYLLSVCQNHNTIQIYNLPPQIISKLNQSNDNQEGSTSNISFDFKNIRGHRGYINDAIFSPIDPNLIISCNIIQFILIIANLNI